MFGVYRVYEDGKLIAEQKNKLTLLGRSNALSTMLGLTQSFAGSFGIGVSNLGNGSETFLNMTDLDFNVGKYPITATSLGTTGSQDALVYTARITDPSRYSIHELGLFSNQISGYVDVDALTLLNFESGDAVKETVSSTDYYLDDPDSTFVSGKKSTVLNDITNYRIGSNAVKLLSSGTIFANDASIDLSAFYNFDKLQLAFYSSGAVTVTVKFSSGANSASYAFVGTTLTYSIISKLKTETSTTSGTVDWSAIDRIDITVSGGTSGTSFAILDGLRISKDKPLDSIDGLVSRAVLSTPISKEAGSIIDIEYLLVFSMDVT
jgi:hypothetical protein